MYLNTGMGAEGTDWGAIVGGLIEVAGGVGTALITKDTMEKQIEAATEQARLQLQQAKDMAALEQERMKMQAEMALAMSAIKKTEAGILGPGVPNWALPVGLATVGGIVIVFMLTR